METRMYTTNGNGTPTKSLPSLLPAADMQLIESITSAVTSTTGLGQLST
jgi:hypothetical protein